MRSEILTYHYLIILHYELKLFLIENIISILIEG